MAFSNNITSHWVKLTVIGFVFISLQGCFSTSMMTTAKTLDKSEQQLSVGVSGYLVDGSAGGIAPDIMYRRGISDKFDFGLGYSMGLYGHIRADLKYELLSWNNNNAFLSTGLGADFYLPDDFGDEQLLGTTIPLYLSINHNKNIVPYFGQRFTFGWNGLKAITYTNSTETIMKNTSLYHSMNYSGAMGFRFGKKQFIELSYSLRKDHYFGSWLKYPDYTEWANTSTNNNSFTIQITYGFIFGPK